MLIKVYLASTGRCYEIEGTKEDTVRSLSRVLAKHFDIATDDQILLCSDGVTLNFGNLLGHHPALSNTTEAHIYVFNKRHSANPDSYPPLPTPLNISDFGFRAPDQQPVQVDPSLTNSRSHMTGAILAYLGEFSYNAQVAREYRDMSILRKRACIKVIEQQRAQVLAMRALLVYLEGYCIGVTRKRDLFEQQFEAQKQWLVTFTEDIETNLAALRSIEVHETLRTSSRSTLLDWMNEGDTRAWVAQLLKKHEHNSGKSEVLLQQFNAVQAEVKQKNEPYPTTILDHIETELKEWAGDDLLLAADVKVVEQDYAEIVEIVRLLEKDISASQSVNILTHEKKHHFHSDVLLVRMQQLDLQNVAKMSAVVGVLSKSQLELSHYFKQTITGVTTLTSKLHNMSSKLDLYGRAFKAIKKKWSSLDKLKRLPEAYRVSLPEVHRRLKFKKLFRNEIEQLNVRIAALRYTENKRREYFHYQYESYLPPGLIPGITQRNLPAFEFSYGDFDQNLPAVSSSMLEGKTTTPTPTTTTTTTTTTAAMDPAHYGVTDDDDGLEDAATLQGMVLEHEALEKEYLASEVARLQLIVEEHARHQSRNNSTRSSRANSKTKTANSNSNNATAAIATATAAQAAEIVALKAALAAEEEKTQKLTTTVTANETHVKTLTSELAQTQLELEQVAMSLQKVRYTTETPLLPVPTTTTTTTTGDSKYAAVAATTAEIAVNVRHIPGLQASAEMLQQWFDWLRLQGVHTIGDVVAIDAAQKVLLQTEISAAQTTRFSAALSQLNVNHLQARMKALLAFSTAVANPDMALISVAPEKLIADRTLLLRAQADTESCKRLIEELTHTKAGLSLELQECQANSADLENKFHVASEDIDMLSSKLQSVAEENIKLKDDEHVLGLNSGILYIQKEELQKELLTLQEEKNLWQQLSALKISFERFQVKDLALFVRTEQGHFTALRSVSVTDPVMYLSSECVEGLGIELKGDKVTDKYVVAEIIMMVAQETTVAYNPYHLQIGTKFWVVDVYAPLQIQPLIAAV